MKTKKLNIELQESEGVITKGRRNVIKATKDTDPEPIGFASLRDASKHIAERGLVYGPDMSEAEIQAQSDSYFQTLNNIAVPFQAGLSVERNQPKPISYNGKLYDVIKGHTTQADWTPDISSSLFVEIQQPETDLLYPEWIQPTGAHDAYDTGDRVTHTGKSWKSTIAANTTEPGTLTEWGYWVEV